MSLPEITDEDRAVAAEATRLYFSPDALANANIPTIVAALVRTGWKPVDPDLKLAREVCAETWTGLRTMYRDGLYDDSETIRCALAAIKAADARRQRNG